MRIFITTFLFIVFFAQQPTLCMQKSSILTASITRISDDPRGALEDIQAVINAFAQGLLGRYDTLVINGSGYPLDIPADKPLIVPRTVAVIVRNMTITIHSASPFQLADPETSSFTCDCTLLCNDPAIAAELTVSAEWVNDTPTVTISGDTVVISATPDTAEDNP